MKTKNLFENVTYFVYSDHEEKETLALSKIGLGKQTVGTIIVVEHDDGSIFTGRVGRKRGLDAYGTTTGRTKVAKYKNMISRNVVAFQVKGGTK